MAINSSPHAAAWLPAYHDGELAAPLRAAVEAHLADCAVCQAELDALSDLSNLLQSSPAPIPSRSQQVFASQVLRSLPAKRQPLLWRQALRTAWQAAPLLLVAGWAFQRAVSWVTGLLLLGQAGGLPLPVEFNSSTTAGWLVWASWLGGWVQQTTPLGLGAQWLAGETLGLWATALLVLLLASWLASWWAFQPLSEDKKIGVQK